MLLLGLLLRPVLALTLEREDRPLVALLVDSSKSMSLVDPRDAAEDRARAAIAGGALAPDAGLAKTPPGDAAATSRAEIASAALGNDKIALLSDLGEQADLVRYSFGGGLTAPGAEPDLPETAIGDALAEVLRRHSADKLAAVLLVTDGANNEGRAPLSAATALRERDVRVFAYGVGTTGSRDIAIESLDLPAVALAEDAVPVTVRIRHRGLAGTAAKLKITLAGVTAGEREFKLDGSGDQLVTIPVIPGKPGEFDIKASVETASGGEIYEDNNALSQGLRVLDSSIRVLMVEGSPRWEFKYIQAMLLRERRIELDCFLAGADPAVTRTPGSPYIEDFPERREDLFGYDLILFGDISPDVLPASTPENLAAFVAEGGGSLAVLAGKRFTPSAYRNTPLERMLPVELGATRLGTAGEIASRPLQLELTDEGLDAAFLNLDDDPERAAERWKILAPIYWTYPAARAKPAARPLLVHPVNKSPVLAIQRYGAGEVMWIGTDNTWRWRRNLGDLYHTRFWGQVVQRLAGRRLATGSRRTELRSDRTVAREGERFTVFARLLGTGFQARTDETIVANLLADDDDGAAPRKVTLRSVPGSPGFYRAEFPAGEPGRYRLTVPDDKAGGLDFTVRGADREFSQTAMDERGLRELAEFTGGAFLREEDLHKLPGMAMLEPAKVTISREAEIWNSPLYLLLLLLPITIEWFMRKFSELK